MAGSVGSMSTTLKVNADTKQAVQEVSKLDLATNKLATGTVPALGSGLGSLSSTLAATSGFAQATGINVTALAGTFAIAGQALGALNPIILVATIAAGIAAVAYFALRESQEEWRMEIEADIDALGRLASGTTDMAGKSRVLVDHFVVLTQAELVLAEADLALIETGRRRIEVMDVLAAVGSLQMLKALALMTGGTIALDESSKDYLDTLRGVVLRVDELRGRLDSLSSAEGEEEASLIRLRAAVLSLQSARLKAQGDTDVQEAERIAKAQIQIIKDSATQKIETTAAEGEAQILIWEAATLRIEAVWLDLTKRYPIIMDSVVVEAERQAAAWTIPWLEAQKQVLSAQARANRLQAALMQESAKAGAEVAAGQISVAQAVGRATLGFAREAVAGELEARAKLWAAEAIAAAAHFNFAKAAGLAAAAIAGGIAVGFIRSAGQDQDEFIQDESVTGVGGGRSSSGRTLIQRGPLTLNYSATMIVNGHVFDLSDIFELFQRFNEDQVRRAGFDAIESSKG